ncbi:MAG TPA: hypothetical protein VLA02_15750 [Reyranella sp.]|nr:hypothetical protein [Reyranella sp.]
MMNRTLFTALAAVAVSTSALIAPAMLTPAAAQSFNVQIGTAPPAPIYEVVPAPRAGYVWAPGYYRYEGSRYHWTSGRFVADRPGYRWMPDRWERGSNGWYHVAGRWDRNGNGIPDRYEHRAERGAWGDRDHDGVPNAYDRSPNNPYRR